MIQNNLKASAQCACEKNKAVHTWKKLQVEIFGTGSCALQCAMIQNKSG